MIRRDLDGKSCFLQNCLSFLFGKGLDLRPYLQGSISPTDEVSHFCEGSGPVGHCFGACFRTLDSATPHRQKREGLLCIMAMEFKSNSGFILHTCPLVGRCKGWPSSLSAMIRLMMFWATIFSAGVVGVSLSFSITSWRVIREGEWAECTKEP